MPNELTPAPGSWYELDTGEVFTVTGIDFAHGLIEVEYVDGRVDQLDLAAWPGLALTEVELPENWHGTIEGFLSGRRGRR
ncbi:hypothetical protein SVA_1780 [Sulfurifustis variabilis]|uniref:Uncharacterized protein n=1 Tax=Sulfurifustis variabilis TaxID=1675686 RepID=A0A1B4VA03_9GAMM|nr:DUF6763 family protein [Sulfurifustis variabilis]BAU48334.1 hypothetical protein SVA_1780 [Sulfurifustis variabilis]